AETGDGADFLDDLDLLVAGSRQNDSELGLLLGRSGGTAARARSRGNRDSGRSRDAPLLFEKLCEFGGLEHGQGRQVVHDLLQISHLSLFLGVSSNQLLG